MSSEKNLTKVGTRVQCLNKKRCVTLERLTGCVDGDCGMLLENGLGVHVQAELKALSKNGIGDSDR